MDTINTQKPRNSASNAHKSPRIAADCTGNTVLMKVTKTASGTFN